jgi:hypothetical protein
MTLTRRGLIVGTASLLAAPALVRAQALMPVSNRHVPVLIDLMCEAVNLVDYSRLGAHRYGWATPDLLRPDSPLMLDCKRLIDLPDMKPILHGYSVMARNSPRYAYALARVGWLRCMEYSSPVMLGDRIKCHSFESDQGQ